MSISKDTPNLSSPTRHIGRKRFNHKGTNKDLTCFNVKIKSFSCLKIFERQNNSYLLSNWKVYSNLWLQKLEIVFVLKENGGRGLKDWYVVSKQKVNIVERNPRVFVSKLLLSLLEVKDVSFPFKIGIIT